MVRYYEDVLKHIPDAKTQALKAAAEAVHKKLLENIDSQIDDEHGKVKSWQEVTMGSYGGYSRIGPKKEDIPNQYGKYYGYNSAQVTAHIERGHAVPSPTGKNKRYQPRFNEDRIVFGENGRVIVPGRPFYSDTKTEAGKIALREMEEVLEGLSEKYVDLLYDLS